MPTFKDSKMPIDKTRENSVAEPKSPDTWRRMCKLADQDKQKQIVCDQQNQELVGEPVTDKLVLDKTRERLLGGGNGASSRSDMENKIIKGIKEHNERKRYESARRAAESERREFGRASQNARDKIKDSVTKETLDYCRRGNLSFNSQDEFDRYVNKEVEHRVKMLDDDTDTWIKRRQEMRELGLWK